MMSYDEEESESSDENLKYRALPVAELPKNFDPTKPPTSAEEYLHHVMWEARQCDDVVTVKIDKSRIKKQSAVVRPNIKEVSPKAYLPDAATQQSILEQFFKTKSQVGNLRKSKNKPNPPTKLPTSENPDHWCQFCFGNAFQRSILLKQQQAKKGTGTGAAKAGASPPPSSSPPAAALGGAAAEVASPSSADAAAQPELPQVVEGQPPLLSILLNIKQATLQNLMEWHVGWLEVAGFSEHQGKWLYSLLACLEKPLIPELCDNVRQMVFLCARARARLDSPKHPFLPQLNLIITIVTRYFNQDDLADPR